MVQPDRTHPVPVFGGDPGHVLLDNLYGFLGGSHLSESVQHIVGIGKIRAVVEKILVEIVVDVPVFPHYGPEDVAGGAACPLCGGEKILDLEKLIGELMPVGIGFVGGEFRVVVDPVLARAASGDHAGMGGIGDAGIDGLHGLDLTAMIHDPLEIGPGPEVFDVFSDHCIHRENKQLLFHDRPPSVI